MTIPKPPKGLAVSGRKLWSSIVKRYDLEEHESTLLLQACRTVDMLDALQAELDTAGMIVASPQGEKVNPAAPELRQQRIALARLLAALRVPIGDDTSKSRDARPQRRAGVRGLYRIDGGAS